MRRHSISDVPDPRTSVPTTIVFPAALDTQSPSFTRVAACQFTLHNH